MRSYNRGRRKPDLRTASGPNERVNLPRDTRRWLRAVEHRTRLAQHSPLHHQDPAVSGRRKQPTHTPSAFQAMILNQVVKSTD